MQFSSDFKPMELQNTSTSHHRISDNKDVTYNILLGDKAVEDEIDDGDDRDDDAHHHKITIKKEKVESFEFTAMETPTWRKVWYFFCYFSLLVSI